MLNFLKTVGLTLLIVAGIGLAIGVGMAITALTAMLSTALLGGFVIFLLVMAVKELFDSK